MSITPTTPYESEAMLGYLGEVRRQNDASPQEYVAVAEVQSFGELGEEGSDVEVTHLLSPNKSTEFMGGMSTPPELQLVCNFRPDHATQSSTAGLIYDKKQGTVRNFEAVHPDWPEKAVFAAVVKSYKLNQIEPNSPQKITFTLKLSGGITWETV